MNWLSIYSYFASLGAILSHALRKFLKFAQGAEVSVAVGAGTSRWFYLWPYFWLAKPSPMVSMVILLIQKIKLLLLPSISLVSSEHTCLVNESFVLEETVFYSAQL